MTKHRESAWRARTPDWHEPRRHARGSPDREVRFEKAARALAEARATNRPPPDGLGVPILIEGPHDTAALRAFGFSGPIEQVNRGWDRGRLIAHLVETYGTRDREGGPAIIVLMDWDRTGGRLQADLTRRLEAMDVRIDASARSTLTRALKPETRTVEGIAPFAEWLLPLMDVRDPPPPQSSE